MTAAEPSRELLRRSRGGVRRCAARGRDRRAARRTHAAVPPINWGVADDASKYADDGGAWFYDAARTART